MSFSLARSSNFLRISVCSKLRRLLLTSQNSFSSGTKDTVDSELKPPVSETGHSESEEDKLSEKKGGFARAFEKYTAKEEPEQEKEEESFASLLRNSKFIDLGDPEGKLVEGTIYHVVNDDLYIDFGWKFPCVCSRPARNGSDFVRGAKVLLRLKELELSTRFLGAERDLTLLEADATLTALLYSPARSGK